MCVCVCVCTHFHTGYVFDRYSSRMRYTFHLCTSWCPLINTYAAMCDHLCSLSHWNSILCSFPFSKRAPLDKVLFCSFDTHTYKHSTYTDFCLWMIYSRVPVVQPAMVQLNIWSTSEQCQLYTWAHWTLLFDSLHKNLAWLSPQKPQNCQTWGVGTCTGLGACLRQYGIAEFDPNLEAIIMSTLSVTKLDWY